MIADTPVGKVSYDQLGEGPDLVLLHSLLADRGVFQRVVPELATRRRVTLIDLPGYGSTDLIEPGIANYADLVHGVITARSMDPSTTAVMGNGLGGFVALATAVYHGSSFDRLVIAGAGAGFPEGGTAAFHTMIDKVRAGGLESVLEIAVRRIFTEEYLAEHPDEGDERRRVLRTADPEAFIRACQTLIDLDLRDAAAEVRNPTLVVVGSEDTATPPEMGKDLSERVPDARFHLLDGLAHAPQLQDPKAFLSVVRPFLEGG